MEQWLAVEWVGLGYVYCRWGRIQCVSLSAVHPVSVAVAGISAVAAASEETIYY